MQLPIDIDYQKYQDKRSQEAYRLYKSFPFNSHILIFKVTRAGATSSLCAESLNLDEKFLALEPTNAIADKTIVASSIRYSSKKDAKVIHILSNHNCLKNQKMIEDYPALAELPYLPLAENCEGCSEYDKCPITEILRVEKWDGVVMTYSKIMALSLADRSRKNSTAGKILDEIEKVQNIILDEAHYIQFGENKKITVFRNYKPVNFDKYDSIKDLKFLGQIITAFNQICKNQEVKDTIHNVHGGAESDHYWKNLLSIPINNPSDLHKRIHYDINFIAGVIKEIIDITKEQDKYELSIQAIKDLFTIVTLVMSERFSVSAIRNKDKIRVELSAIDDSKVNILRSFVMSMQLNRRIFVTSATICSFDYGKLFMDGKIDTEFFGKNGDPINTNSQMLILADSKKISDGWRKESLKNNLNEVCENIIKIFDMYGMNNCIIIAISWDEHELLREALEKRGYAPHITYYQSSETIGVECDKRIVIAVGIGHQPSNAFDSVTKTVLESRIMRQESQQANTWQAWSRAKDQNGKIPSLVFGLGCTKEECENLVTWGSDRRVTIDDIEKEGKKNIEVKCTKYVTKPKVIKCKDFDMMLSEAMKHRIPLRSPNIEETQTEDNSLNKNTLTHEIPYINKYTRDFNNLMYLTLDSSKSLVGFIFNRMDLMAIQNKDGSYKSVKMSLNERVIQAHLDGTTTLAAYPVNKENMIKWISWDLDAHRQPIDTDESMQNKFDKVESDLNRLCNYLENQGIPYMLEASGSPGSYHVWTFVQPVLAEIGKAFATDIKNTLGIDAEVFPKTTVVNDSRPGIPIKVPLATHQKHGGKSMVMLNGEFVRDFKDMDICIIDISGYRNVETIKKPGRKSTKTTFSMKIRPCVEKMVLMDLTDGGGHVARRSVVREFYNAGIKDPEMLAKLFAKQGDYDFQYSVDQVNSLIKYEMPNVRCSTLKEECNKWIDCTGCQFNNGITA